jgi:hypothetical protein
MIESKFLFIGKIFLISFFIINLPYLLPVNLFNISYLIILTTTIFDTSSLLVLSLSISKFIHKRNLSKVENLNIKKGNNEYRDQINTYSYQVHNDSKLSLILAISFAFFTLIQPILLAIDINAKDIFAGNVVNSINSNYLEQKNKIDELILKEKNQINDKKELSKLENRITNLTKLKNKNIERYLENNNANKFSNLKIIIRNFFLGLLFSLCFYKIYKI